MELESYLAAIESVTDPLELRDEFGIYDYYTIFLRTDINKILLELTKSSRFSSGRTDPEYGIWLVRNDGQIQVALIPDLSKCLTLTYTFEKEEERLGKEYSLAVALHLPTHGSQDYQKIIAARKETIKEIGNFAVQNKVALCLPCIGWKYLNPNPGWERFSTEDRLGRVVRYNPS